MTSSTSGHRIPPSPEALASRERARALLIERHGVLPSTGQHWRHRTTGEVVALIGRKRAAWGIATVVEHETDTTTARLLPLDDLDEHFEFVGCDHDAACCTSHGTHTSPHRGCILR